MHWRVSKRALLAGAFFIAWAGWSAPATRADATGLVEVAYVIDGDSLQLKSGQQVRLIGVNTPEMHGADDQPEPLAINARDTLIRLIDKRPVRLIPGNEKRDRHLRLLAYVETADGRDVQERLLTEGLGFLVAIPPNTDRLTRYQAAQQRARAARRGVWDVPAFAPLAAEQIGKHDPLRGFKQVHGTVNRYNASKSYYYFRLSPGFEFKVPRINWLYFDGSPKGMVGKTVTVRGWVTRGKYRLQMRVGHPSMMDMDTSS